MYYETCNIEIQVSYFWCTIQKHNAAQGKQNNTEITYVQLTKTYIWFNCSETDYIKDMSFRVAQTRVMKYVIALPQSL